MDAAVFAWGTIAVQHSGAVISEQFVNSVVLIHRVMMVLALTTRLPSIAAMSHRVVHRVMEPQLFDLRALLWCGSCTIRWVGALLLLSKALGRWTSGSCSGRRMWGRAEKPPWRKVL